MIVSVPSSPTEVDVLPAETLISDDDITRLASYLCQTPIALISLVNADSPWFKPPTGPCSPEPFQGMAFCAHALNHPDLFIIPDAQTDPRFIDDPLVTGEARIRFYAGVPLRTSGGHTLGTLCVLDRQPRNLTPEQRSGLRLLASQVVARLDRQHQTAPGGKDNPPHTAVEETPKQETESHFRSVVEGLNEGILITDLDDIVLYINPQLSEMTGYTCAEMLGRPAYEFLLPPEDWPDLAQRNNSRARGVSENWETRLLRKEGTRFWVKIGASPFRDASGRIIGTLGVITDIKERKQVEDDLRASRAVIERNNSLLLAQKEASLDAILVVDERHQISSYNKRFCELWSIPDALIRGGDDAPVLSCVLSQVEDAEAFLRRIKSLYEQVGESSQDEVRLKDGRCLDRYSAPVVSENGENFGRIWHFRDITERKRAEVQRETLLAEALEQADQDPLTGLWNHRAFHRRLEEEADRAQREGGSLAVVMLDLDNFKFFNDAYGHAAGDDVLRRVAEALSGACRSSDTLARFGGDEFALLLSLPGPESTSSKMFEKISDPDKVHTVLAGIHARVAECLKGLKFLPPGHDCALPLEVSFGAALFPQEAATRAEVLPLADERLFRTKGGRSENESAERPRRHLLSSTEGYSMLDALVAAVDNKDRYTRRHSEDVLTYSLQIARKLGLDAQTQHTVQVAALLHDVGKIGVPDSILRKPGTLTDEEFEAVKQHPVMGAVIVGAVPGLEDTLDAVRHHHERWDGGGYPFGLRGEETPLIARLMAVADAFSAMTTDRPYRTGMAEEQALSILEAGSGSQWDPACVRAFLLARQSKAPERDHPEEHVP